MQKICKCKGCPNRSLKFGKSCYKHAPKCAYPECGKVVREDGYACKKHQKTCEFRGCKRIISLELSVCKKHQKKCQVCKRWYRGDKCESYQCKKCKTEGCEIKPFAWTYCYECICHEGIDCNCTRKKSENRKTCEQCYTALNVTWVLGQLFCKAGGGRQSKYPIKKIMKRADLPYLNLRSSTCKVKGCHVQLPNKMYYDGYIPTCEGHRHFIFCLHPNCFIQINKLSDHYPYCGEMCEPNCMLHTCKYYNPEYHFTICRHCECRTERCNKLSLVGSNYCETCYKSHLLYFVLCKKFILPRDLYRMISRDAGVKKIAKPKN